ncbi:prepilin peptidase [Oligoflexia bacterium]|nr:prepilin peptidase [Oligoflexia bacterium]
MATLFIQLVCIFFGLVIGSFLSVCIYRIPLGRPTGLDDWDEEAEEAEGEEEGEEEEDPLAPNCKHFDKKVSITHPKRSFCPHCGAQLAWYHNVPLFSWLFLGGKCAFCKVSISARYPAVELLSMVLCLMTYQTFGLTPTAVVVYAFCCALIVISFIDYDYYIIPNVISLPGTAIGIALAAINNFFGIFTLPVVPGIKASLLGILLGAGILLVISEGYFRLRKKQGLGMGDVKLLAMTGALFGVEASIYTIFIGSLLGSIIGVLLIIIGGRKMSHYIPFGPYLAVATVLFLFSGMTIAEYIMKLIGGTM